MTDNININNKNNKNKTTGKLIIISGPAGSGKSTVLKELSKLSDYKFSLSATTRPPRDGEKNGLDYYFISKDEFFKKISDVKCSNMSNIPNVRGIITAR